MDKSESGSRVDIKLDIDRGDRHADGIAEPIDLAGTLAAQEKFSPRWLGAAALLFGAGILLFSGSLYGLALGAPGWTGMITPVGGLLFMVGWLALAFAVLGGRSQSGE